MPTLIDLMAARNAMLGIPLGRALANWMYPPQQVIAPRDASRDALFGVPAGPIQTVEMPAGPIQTVEMPAGPMDYFQPPEPNPRNTLMVRETVPTQQVPAMAVDQPVTAAPPSALFAPPMETVTVPDAQVPMFPVDQPSSPAAAAAKPGAAGVDLGSLIGQMMKMKAAGGTSHSPPPVPMPIVQGRFFGDTPGGVQKAMSEFGAAQGPALSAQAAAQAQLGAAQANAQGNVAAAQERSQSDKANADASRVASRDAMMSREKIASAEIAQRASEAEAGAKLEEKRLGILAKQAEQKTTAVSAVAEKAALEDAALAKQDNQATNDLVVTANRDFPAKLNAIADTFEKKVAGYWLTGGKEAKRQADIIRSSDPAKISQFIKDHPDASGVLAEILNAANSLVRTSPVGAAVEFDPSNFTFKRRASAASGPAAMMGGVTAPAVEMPSEIAPPPFMGTNRIGRFIVQ